MEKPPSSLATGHDFVKVAVGALTEAKVGRGLAARAAVLFLQWLLSSLASLLPMDLINYLVGRKLSMEDVAMAEVILRDSVQVYSTWMK